MFTVNRKKSITENLCVADCTCVYGGGRHLHAAKCLRTRSSVLLNLPHNFHVFYVNLPSLKCVHFIRCKERSILDDINTKQLKWYGHVQRMEEGRLPKQAMKCNPPGRRKRGRPKLTWAEGIRGLMGGKGTSGRRLE